MKIKVDWVCFYGKVRTITRPGTLVAFLESCLSISEANECLTSVNMKRNQETQRQGKWQHLKANTAL